MRISLGVVVVATLVLSAGASAPAIAAPTGPICVSLAPAPNFFVLFVDSNGGNQFTITGRDIGVGDRPLTGAGFVTGSTFKMGFSLYAVSADQPSSVGSASINVNTGSGPGVARALDGVDIPFTMTVASCPPSVTQ